MKPDPKAITRKLRAEAAAGAFPILDQLRERHADVADFDTVVDALVKARVQGWQDAAREAARRNLDIEGCSGDSHHGMCAFLSELRRMIRAARS